MVHPLTAFAVLLPACLAVLSFGQVAAEPGFDILRMSLDPVGSAGVKVIVATFAATVIEQDANALGLALVGAVDSGADPTSSKRLFRPMYQDIPDSLMLTPCRFITG